MKPQRSKPQNLDSNKKQAANLVFTCASGINAILPCMNILSLCSIPDYTDSTKVLFDYIGRKELTNKPLIVWHVKNVRRTRERYQTHPYSGCRVLFVKKNRMISFIMFCLSRYIVDTHGLYSMVKLKNRQKSLYLTHGMPVKKFGFEYENDIQNGVQHADYALATSLFYQDVISRSMGIEKGKVYPIGLPRNDVFFEEDKQSEKILEVLSKKYVLFLPTYRVADKRNKNNGRDLNTGNLLLGGSQEEWSTLNQVLKEYGMRIVIKPHPLEMHNNLEPLKAFSQVILIDDGWIIQNDFSLNLIMKYSSALITDYSGAFVDYLLTDKPIVFYMPDYHEYKDSRGYVFDDFINMIPGEVVAKFSDLKDALGKDDYREKRAKVQKKLNSQTAATAAEKTSALLLGK